MSRASEPMTVSPLSAGSAAWLSLPITLLLTIGSLPLPITTPCG
jgi:hypothetical protein